MKYKKVQLLKDRINELGINCVEAAYKLGVRYETLQQMFRRGNIIIDSAVYQPTKHDIHFDESKGLSSVLYLQEFLSKEKYTHDDLAALLCVERQTVTLMVGKGCIVFEGRIYSPKKYRLK